MFPSQLMAAATAWGVLVPVALGLPQTQAPPVITPTVDSLNMSGPGCPLGAGGIVKGVKNSTPVFLFTEWEISRADADANASSVSKWCTQQMALSSIPSGQQIRLSNVNISGWATLDPESKLELSFETRLGDLSAAQTATINPGDLKSNAFQVALKPLPDTWSACVDSTGKIPSLSLKMNVTLVGSKLPSGSYSGGVVGGEKSDLSKALSLHFDPEWRACSPAK